MQYLVEGSNPTIAILAVNIQEVEVSAELLVLAVLERLVDEMLQGEGLQVLRLRPDGLPQQEGATFDRVT